MVLINVLQYWRQHHDDGAVYLPGQEIEDKTPTHRDYTVNKMRGSVASQFRIVSSREITTNFHNQSQTSKKPRASDLRAPRQPNVNTNSRHDMTTSTNLNSSKIPKLANSKGFGLCSIDTIVLMGREGVPYALTDDPPDPGRTTTAKDNKFKRDDQKARPLCKLNLAKNPATLVTSLLFPMQQKSKCGRSWPTHTRRKTYTQNSACTHVCTSFNLRMEKTYKSTWQGWKKYS